jgi:hypothetical protein
MLTDEEFIDFVQRQNESRHLEFKPPGRRDDPYLFAQVTRAALGMANTRDGGRIILFAVVDSLSHSVSCARGRMLMLEV